MRRYFNIPFTIWKTHILSTKSIKQRIPSFSTTSNFKKYEEEPEYLKYTKPLVPVFDLLDIQIKCYDYTVLEHYGKHVHRIALQMDINVTDAWATPHQAWKVTNCEPGTTAVTTEYKLNTYERNIQIKNLHAYSAPLFFEMIQSALPSGVTVRIQPHKAEYEEILYIPDFELLALKGQLEEMIALDTPPA